MTVWSLTPYLNEVDAFEIRLAELDPVVDIHVIAESTTTYSGDPKPLFYEEDSDRFKPWKDKIRRVIVDDPPPKNYGVFQPFGDPDRWRRENWQRAALSRALKDLEPDDVVIVSDADEIPRAELILEYLEREITHPVRPHLPMHVGMLNWRWPHTLGVILRVFRGHELLQGGHDPETIRRVNVADEWTVPNWPIFHGDGNGYDLGRYGWHLSYLGGPDAIRYKLRVAAHPELEREEWMTDEHIERCLATGHDLFDRPDRWCYWIPPSLLPPYVQANEERFADLLAPRPSVTDHLSAGNYR